MKKLLLPFAIILDLVCMLIWFLQGANTGWTKTFTEVEKFDPITEITYPERVDKLTLGIDFIFASSALCIFLILVAIFINRRPKTDA